MNNRIYQKELFEKELKRILSKKYCQECFLDNKKIGTNNTVICKFCNKETILVSKEELRNLKIDRVVKK